MCPFWWNRSCQPSVATKITSNGVKVPVPHKPLSPGWIKGQGMSNPAPGSKYFSSSATKPTRPSTTPRHVLAPGTLPFGPLFRTCQSGDPQITFILRDYVLFFVFGIFRAICGREHVSNTACTTISADYKLQTDSSSFVTSYESGLEGGGLVPPGGPRHPFLR